MMGQQSSAPYQPAILPATSPGFRKKPMATLQRLIAQSRATRDHSRTLVAESLATRIRVQAYVAYMFEHRRTIEEILSEIRTATSARRSAAPSLVERTLTAAVP